MTGNPYRGVIFPQVNVAIQIHSLEDAMKQRRIVTLRMAVVAALLVMGMFMLMGCDGSLASDWRLFR